MVDLPEAERPVNQTVHPFCLRSSLRSFRVRPACHVILLEQESAGLHGLCNPKWYGGADFGIGSRMLGWHLRCHLDCIVCASHNRPIIGLSKIESNTDMENRKQKICLAIRDELAVTRFVRRPDAWIRTCAGPIRPSIRASNVSLRFNVTTPIRTFARCALD